MVESPKKEDKTDLLSSPLIIQSMVIDPLCRNYRREKDKQRNLGIFRRLKFSKEAREVWGIISSEAVN